MVKIHLFGYEYVLMRSTILCRGLCIEQITIFEREFCRFHQFWNFWKQNQTTTLGATFPTLCENCVNSWTSPANQYRGDTGDGAYGVSSLPEKLKTSNPIWRCHS